MKMSFEESVKSGALQRIAGRAVVEAVAVRDRANFAKRLKRLEARFDREAAEQRVEKAPTNPLPEKRSAEADSSPAKKKPPLPKRERGIVEIDSSF